jgi:hypothetical protein
MTHGCPNSGLHRSQGRVLAGKGSHVVDKGVLSQESLMGVEMRDKDLVELAQAIDDAGHSGREGLAYFVTVTRRVSAEGNLTHGSAIEDRVQLPRAISPSISKGLFKTQSFGQHAAVLGAGGDCSAGQSSDGEMVLVRNKCNAHGTASVAAAAI